ncbi:MAG: hypothetical protein JSU65_03870, partial [Candidatus Zixiibacteriota bacterium]
MLLDNIRKALLIPLAALVVCLCVVCGTRKAIDPLATPETVSKLIDENGGNISLGPLTVWIPADALDSAVTFSITEVWTLPVFPANYTGSGFGYALEPHGYAFKNDVSLEIKYDTMMVGPTLMVLQDATDDSWEALGNATFNNGIATVWTQHLSIFSLARFNPLTDVYVSKRSRGDFAAGTSDDPLPTLALGIDVSLAAGEPLPTVHVAVGEYDESPVFHAGVDIEGGLDSLSWKTVTGAFSVFRVGTTPAIAEDIAVTTRVSGVHILAANAPDGLVPARSSIALRLDGCSDALEFNSCRFEAGRGANGTTGADGSPGASGARGLDGNYTTGGGGGSGAYAGGKGGNGKDASIIGEYGEQGQGPAGGPGGSPGYWGAGNPGGSGGSGADGANGYGGTSAGSYGRDMWTPSSG